MHTKGAILFACVALMLVPLGCLRYPTNLGEIVIVDPPPPSPDVAGPNCFKNEARPDGLGSRCGRSEIECKRAREDADQLSREVIPALEFSATMCKPAERPPECFWVRDAADNRSPQCFPSQRLCSIEEKMIPPDLVLTKGCKPYVIGQQVSRAD